jgi:Leucine-rich repeat (LRR) protein
MASAASGPHDQISELSLYDAGIVSLAELSDLPRMTALRSLNLHCNRIEAISNLESLGGLTYLNLSSNHIEAMTNLHGLVRLQTLDLSCNRVRIVDGLATLRSLRRLLLAYNRITSLAGLVQCHGGQLAHFEAYGNRIALIREAEYLRGLPMLAEVVLCRHGQDNPV